MTSPPAPSATPGRWLRGLELDLRSLALFRISLGLVLLADLLLRIPQIDDFYTDRGIVPRPALLTFFGTPWTISFHLISGEWTVQLALFLAAVVLAIGFTVGYRTGACAVASWLLLFSAHARNPAILHGGDAVLRMMLFWCMFAPLSARFSLDRALNPSAAALPVRHLSPAGLALLFQVCGIYWYAASEKMHPAWLTERSAVYYALMLDQLATPFGKFLLGYPELLRQLSVGTVLLEFIGPLLVISPLLTGPLRLLVVPSFIAFHAGLGLAMHLGIFPWVCAAAWLLVLPPSFWRALERRQVHRPDAAPSIFFDATCSFCRKGVLILRELLILPSAEVREAQSDSEMRLLMQARHSWIVRDAKGGAHSGYDGFVELSRRSPIARWFTGVLDSRLVRRFGERTYRWVADHRTTMSRRLGTIIPSPPRQPGVVGSLLVLACLALVTASFVGTEPRRNSVGGRFLSLTMMSQSWKMFAPPTPYDGWYVMEGITKDGSRLDVWNGGGQPTDDKPADVARSLRNSQWGSYLRWLPAEGSREWRPYFGRYLCRSWNEAHGRADDVVLIHVIFFSEYTPPPGRPQPPPTRDLVWQQPCP